MWYPQGRRYSRVCSQLENSWLHSFGIRKMFFLWTSCFWGQLWNQNRYVSTSNEPEWLTLSYSSNRKNVCSVAPPWHCWATHKYAHHRGHLKYWIDNVASGSVQCWPYTIPDYHLFSLWGGGPLNAPLCKWQGTAECLASVTAEDREQLLLGVNACCCW